jgi:hypothetical protein
VSSVPLLSTSTEVLLYDGYASSMLVPSVTIAINPSPDFRWLNSFLFPALSWSAVLWFPSMSAARQHSWTSRLCFRWTPPLLLRV